MTIGIFVVFFWDLSNCVQIIFTLIQYCPAMLLSIHYNINFCIPYFEVLGILLNQFLFLSWYTWTLFCLEIYAEVLTFNYCVFLSIYAENSSDRLESFMCYKPSHFSNLTSPNYSLLVLRKKFSTIIFLALEVVNKWSPVIVEYFLHSCHSCIEYLEFCKVTTLS